MRTSSNLRFLALLSPLVFTGAAMAQTAAESSGGCPQANCSPPLAPTAESTSNDTAASQPAIYSASLNGTGPISLINSIPSHLLLGASVAGGFDTNPNSGNSGVSSGFAIVSPYLGLRLSTPRSQTLLQYNLTDTNYASSYAGQMLHAGSIRHFHSLTDRWTLDFDALATYGQNNVRFLGAQQSLISGNVQGVGPGAASYLADSGNVTDVSAGIGATYQLSATDSVRFHITSGLTRFAGLSQANSIATETISFAHDVSPVLEVSVYTQGSHYYGSIRCDSLGAGVGVQWLPSEKTVLSASAGPQLDAPNCGAHQGAAYSVSLTRKLAGRSEFYVLSKREPGTSYLGPGLWRDSAAIGYERLVTKTSTLRFSVAYLHSLNLNGNGSYDPIYFDGGYEHHLSRTLHASFTYRAYTDLSAGAIGSRNAAMLSLNWSPDHVVSSPQ